MRTESSFCAAWFCPAFVRLGNVATVRHLYLEFLLVTIFSSCEMKQAAVIAVCVIATLAKLDAVNAVETPAARPNIVFVLADDLGWSELGCYGNGFNETPHLDRLALDGMRFTQAYAAAPVCSPYRAALLTGQAPARIGILDYLRPNSANAL